MIFNSLTFAVFFVAVFVVYWVLLPRFSLAIRNLFLLVVSYVFYGYWDWRFLSLIIFSSMVDYSVGKWLEQEEGLRRRRLLLGLSLASNLTVLGVFKYFNFFVDSLVAVCSEFGWCLSVPTLKVLLPVGISFYTFQTLGYTIDVYRRSIPACRSRLVFFAFVAYFPQLVAGPIERARNLLPQFQTAHKFSYPDAVDGCRQILYGLFCKIVIADNLAHIVDRLFGEAEHFGCLDLWFATFLFGIQIYCDFAGYSQIACGTARLLGFTLMQNFKTPYFSVSIQQFWQRWHVSLSTWFRDYLYFPQGGSRGSTWALCRNTMVVFLASGLWHGANWTFVLWGGLHGTALLVARGFKGSLGGGKLFALMGWLGTMYVVFIGWVLFRSDSLSAAATMLRRMHFPAGDLVRNAMVPNYTKAALLCFLLLGIDWLNRNRAHPLEISHWSKPARWVMCHGMVVAMILFGKMNHAPFIYFQF